MLVNFTYSASNPAGVDKEPGPGTELGTTYHPDPNGRLRLWTKDGDQRRSVLPIPQGDYVPPGWHELAHFGDAVQEDGTIRLYLEAVQPSEAQGADRILVQVKILEPSGALIYEGEDAIRVTSVDVEMHDLRAWGPVMNPDGSAGIENTNLDEIIEGSRVGGAITDGASICLLRMVPGVNFQLAGVSQAKIEVWKADNTIPGVEAGGSLKEIQYTFAGIQLPPLPEPYPPDPASWALDFSSCKVFYVPPDNYLLNAGSSCLMYFSVWLTSGEESLLGRVPFILRRPPLILVHGLNSSPSTWHPSIWNEAAMGTRIYHVDYTSKNKEGFDESWFLVPRVIEDALEEYRHGTGDENHPAVLLQNIPLAATRADVVGHSMGGIITRVYVSNLNVFDIPRERKNVVGEWQGYSPPWPTINVGRLPQSVDSSGRWHYLRNENFGAGSIRRFISIGTPFDGSPLAEMAVGVYAGDNTWKRMVRKKLPRRNANPTVADSDLGVPPALIDLGPESTF